MGDEEDGRDLHVLIDERQWRDGLIEQRLIDHPEEATHTDTHERLPIHAICVIDEDSAPLSLFQALVRSHPESLKVQDVANDTPLHLSVWFMQEEVAQYLLEADPSITSVAGNHGFLPHHVACWRYMCCGDAVWMRYLLKLCKINSAGPTVADSSGNTPLEAVWLWDFQEEESICKSPAWALDMTERFYRLAILILLFEYNGTMPDLDGLMEGDFQSSPQLSGIVHAVVKVGKKCGVPDPIRRLIAQRHQEQLLISDERGKLPVQVAPKGTKEERDFAEFLELLHTNMVYFLIRREPQAVESIEPENDNDDTQSKNKKLKASFDNNKVAMITGAAGTIGYGIAKCLFNNGYTVILVGRTIKTLEAAKQKLLNASSSEATSRVVVISADVSNEESVMQLFTTVDEKTNGNGVDLLINNAGINAPGASIDLPGHDFERVLQVNTLGPFLCAREAMKRMKVKGGGRIINMGSISAQSPRPDAAPYTASKFALLGLTQSLSLDARQYNIAVGIIHPGNVRSDLLSETEAEYRSKTEGFMEPSDVAECVLTMAKLPYSANVLEMTVIPTKMPFVGRG